MLKKITEVLTVTIATICKKKLYFLIEDIPKE